MRFTCDFVIRGNTIYEAYMTIVALARDVNSSYKIDHFFKAELLLSFPAALWPPPLTGETVLVPAMTPASAQAPAWPSRLRLGVESQPLGSMLHRDMARRRAS